MSENKALKRIETHELERKVHRKGLIMADNKSLEWDNGETITGEDVAWQTWTPTYSAGGSMTYSSVTSNVARYCTIGSTVMFQLVATGTTGGTASTYVSFTLPVAPANTGDANVSGGCRCGDGGGVAGHYRYDNSDAAVFVFKYDSSNWGLGSGRQIMVQGQYEI